VRLIFISAVGQATGLLTMPWERPLADWADERLVEIRERGISRRVVRFVCDDGTLYALKELSERLARREYRLLRALAASVVLPARDLPVITTPDAGQVRPPETTRTRARTPCHPRSPRSRCPGCTPWRAGRSQPR
jgi:hypothetical protein